MAAMEGDGDRPVGEQRVETDEPPGFVGKRERGHDLARFGCGLAGVVRLQPLHHPVDGLLHLRPQRARRIGEGLEPFAQ